MLLLLSSLAFASPVEFYGFGARAMGRAQGGVSLPGDAGAAFLNPAALAGQDNAQILLGYTAVRFDFQPLPPVYWDTNRDGAIDDLDAALQLESDPDNGDGVMAGFSRPLTNRFGIGAGLFVPTARILRLQTMEPRLPAYFMYQNRTQRYAFAAGFGGQPLPGVHIGGGIRLLTRSTLSATMTMNVGVSGEDPDQASAADLVDVSADVHDMTFDLKPMPVPVFGIQLMPGDWVPALEGTALGFTWRGAGGVPVDFSLDAQANMAGEDLGDLEPLIAAAVVQISMSVFDHYLPQQFVFGGSWTYQDIFSVYMDVQHTRWAALQLNVTEIVGSEIQSTLGDLSGVDIDTNLDVTDALFRNTWSVRTGTELVLPRFPLPGNLGWKSASFRGGFGYEPTPLVQQGPNTALLDADRLIFSLGAGVAHGSLFELVEGPIRWDAFFQIHTLASGTLQRPAIDAPRAGYAVDNAPIPIGGRFYAVGAQWSFDY